MRLSIDEVRRIAGLAMLDLAPEEIPPLTEQLGTILDYVDRLNEIDTASLAPDIGEPVGEDTLREDRNRPGLDLDAALSNAPDAAADHFRVPRILG